MSRAHSRRLNLLAIVVLVVALAAGTGLRIHAQQANPNVQHDEAWSYASAAGRLGPFMAAMDGGLTGRWVPAGEWQRFWTSDGLGGVSDIAPDLAAYDVHPPLYFGLLHGWLTITGQHMWAGRALNLVFAALAVLGIFGLARALGFDRLEGALAALVWAVSPAVVSISSLTRQYDLVALTTILLVWGLVRTRRAGRRDGGRRSRLRPWLDVLWLAAATGAALLTHYQAVLLVAGARPLQSSPASSCPAGTARRRPWWPPLLGLAAGTLVAALLAPGWPGAFGRERSRLGDALRERLLREARRDRADTRPVRRRPRPRGAWPAGPRRGRRRRHRPAPHPAHAPRPRAAACGRRGRAGGRSSSSSLVTAGGVCLQNLLFLSMPPLISARYLAMAWPFVAFLPLLVFGIWPRLRYALTAAFCLLVLIPATIAAPLLYERRRPAAARAARRGRRRAHRQRRRRRAPAVPLVGAGRRPGLRRHAGGAPRAQGGLA